MMEVVRLEHVDVVILLKADGNGVVMMPDQWMSQELAALMNANFAKLFDMLEFKDVIDLVDQVLV